MSIRLLSPVDIIPSKDVCSEGKLSVVLHRLLGRDSWYLMLFSSDRIDGNEFCDFLPRNHEGLHKTKENAVSFTILFSQSIFYLIPFYPHSEALNFFTDRKLLQHTGKPYEQAYSLVCNTLEHHDTVKLKL